MAVLKRLVALVAAVASLALPAAAQDTGVARAHHLITTTVPAAQAAFDRGLIMLYAFNVGEARAAFRAAEAADPRAALPYFGEAIAETIDINTPTTPGGERRGAEAVDRGRKAAGPDAPDDDRLLLAAASARYDLSTSQDQRFAAYFHALQAYAHAHPADGMAFTLAAYAGWDATGRLTQDVSDALTPDAQAIGDDLDAALKIDPGDVGAHHLRIHFWEEVHRPERALTDADALAALTYEPGQSHLEHMAGHIYDRLGDYAQMVRVNQSACANDDAYFKLGNGDGQKYMRAYHEHDVAFVLYGLTTVGRYTDARAFARRESEYSRELVALRTRDNREVLALLGDAVTPMRVIAEARLGELESARADLARLTGGKGSEAGATDYAVAAGAVARAAHDAATAVDDYRQARAAAGSELGDPKNRWWTPVAEGLGASLLEAGRPAEAERVFRDELVRFPNDPHLEFGLAEALGAQGKDAAQASAAYRAAWQGERPLSVADLG